MMAVLSATLPLTSYALSLSLFGMPHIYYELAYIKNRYYGDMHRDFKLTLAVILGLACICNIIGIFIHVSKHTEIILTLFLLLVLTSFLFKRAALTFIILLVTAWCIYWQPILTFFTIAFLHNFTPWLFLKERHASKNAHIVFIILPIAVLALTYYFSLYDVAFYQLATQKYFLSHYIPGVFQNNRFSNAIFATAVYLQLIHYYSTIHLLPKLMTYKFKLIFPALMLFGVFVIGFVANFTLTRSVYAVFAGFHSWVEVPIILTMMTFTSKLVNLHENELVEIQT